MGVDDPVIVRLRYAAFDERELGVGDRGIVDRDEDVEAAARGGPLIW
jgi:hypothetical protein